MSEVECLVCHEKYARLGPHLRSHNMDVYEYLRQFPGAETSSAESRLKTSQTLQGHEVSEETREKISNGNTGKEVSEETRRKKSESMTQIWKDKGYIAPGPIDRNRLIPCLLCNKSYFDLGVHLPRTHKITLADYQQRFPAARTVSIETSILRSRGLREAHALRSTEVRVAINAKIAKTLDGHEVSTETRDKMAESKKDNSNAIGPHVFDGTANPYNAAYYQKNKEQLKQRTREYQHANYDKVSAHHRQYLKDHPEVEKAYVNNYRARLYDAEGFFTFDEWVDLCIIHEGKCAYCGTLCNLTADHKIPLSRGGTNSIDNILPACKSCNSSKGALTREEYLKRMSSMRQVPEED